MAKALMRKDLSNQRFGKLLVKYIDESRTCDGKVYWICDCDCGNTTSVQSTALTRKKNGTYSCGCARNSEESKEKLREKRKEYPNDISNYKFGRLTVLRKTTVRSHRKSDHNAFLWECLCECGEICYYSRYNLVSSCGVKSCGCLYKDSRHETLKKYCEYDLTTYDFGVGYCNNGTYFIFDKEDYEKINQYCWWYDGRYVVAHSLPNDKYTTSTIRLHRVVMDLDDREDINIDHKNLVRYDCRKINLRKATCSENACNKDYSYMCSDSGIVGVRKNNRGKWTAHITINGKDKCVGTFELIEEAAEARLNAEIKYYKEFRFNPDAYDSINEVNLYSHMKE